MTNEFDPRSSHALRDEAPTWLRALQAALIGLVAGLVLHAILAMASVQAGGTAPAHVAPTECKKSSPVRDAGAPNPGGPAAGGRWTPAL